jgi:hypothetical protein
MQNASFGTVANNNKGNTGTLSLVFGSLAFVAVFVPIVCLLSWVLAPVGLLFGILSLRSQRASSVAKAGIVLSLLALVGCLVWIFVFDSSFSVRPALPGEQGVTYSVQEKQVYPAS